MHQIACEGQWPHFNTVCAAMHQIACEGQWPHLDIVCAAMHQTACEGQWPHFNTVCVRNLFFFIFRLQFQALKGKPLSFLQLAEIREPEIWVGDVC